VKFVNTRIFLGLLWATQALVILALLFVYTVFHDSLRKQAIEAEGQNNQAIAQAITAHTEAVFSHADSIARFVQKDWRRLDRSAITDFVDAKQLSRAGILQVALVDAKGLVTWGSLPFFPATSIADREHFKVHIAPGGPERFLSDPVLGRVSKMWSIQLTRRLTDAAGRFAGVVVVSINPEHFSERYLPLQTDSQRRIAVVSTDSSLILARGAVAANIPAISIGESYAKHPVMQASRGIPAGYTEGRSVLRTVPLIYGWSRSANYPLLTVVATDLEATRGLHRQAEINLSWAIGIAIALLLATGWVVSWAVLSQAKSLRALEDARRAAEESDAFKSEFINAISHEVRGPLTNINGFAELMSMAPLDQDIIKDYSTTILRAGEHLERIVNQLLDAEKANLGKLVLHLEPTDVRALIAQCVHINSVAAMKKGLELKLNFEGEIPLSAWLDGLRFSQVVHNFLNNAIKFTTEGSVNVDVFADKVALRVTVRDTGPGIALRYQKRIFERFRQGDPLLSRIYGGTGLGLSLSKSLVELMGGRIWFESMVEVGSTFAFEIPLVHELQSIADLPETAAQA
jgi:signal transduction histidine kinase